MRRIRYGQPPWGDPNASSRSRRIALGVLAALAHVSCAHAARHLQGVNGAEGGTLVQRHLSEAGSGAIQVACGDYHTCALLSDGEVVCWGSGSSGKLGYANTETIGDNEHPSSAGTVNLGPNITATQVTAGLGHTCALLSDGGVMCWGIGADGRLGYANTENIGDDEHPFTAGTVDLGPNITATQVAAGSSHTCALLSDGGVMCWGDGSSGRLGYAITENIGDDEHPFTAGTVDLGPNITATQVSAGGSHTCALLSDGGVMCWGSASSGRLGYASSNAVGDDEHPSTAGTVNLGLNITAIQVSVGKSHTCALLSDGGVMCWGRGSRGQLGYASTGNIGDNEQPADAGTVNLGSNITATQVVVGSLRTCALLTGGDVKCWGSSLFGPLGYAHTQDIGDDEHPSSVGTVDLGPNITATQLAAGIGRTCVLLSDGDVMCWGNGGSGRLGYANIEAIGDDEHPSSAGTVQLVPLTPSVDAFPDGSSDHIITVTEGEPTGDATFEVVLSGGRISSPSDALNARIVVTSTDPTWAPLKDTDSVLQPGSSSLDITIGTPAVVVGSATYTVTVATTSLDYEALAGALADFTTADDPDIVLEFVVQFETSPGVWDAASETAFLTLSNAQEPPTSITGSDMTVMENAETSFPDGATFPALSIWDDTELSFYVISTDPSFNTGADMADGSKALDTNILSIMFTDVNTTAADVVVAAVDTEALQARAGVDLATATHDETFTFPIKLVVCGPSSCVESDNLSLIVTDIVEPELEIESFPQSLTYTIDEATAGPTTPTVQDFYVRLHDLNRNGNLLDFTLNLQGPSGDPVPEPLQGLMASCGTFTHTTPNAYLEATCSIDTADASFDLEALRVALEGTVTTASPLTGQHYSVEGTLGEAPLRVVVSSSIPEQDNVQGPAYDVLVADMDEDPLDLALDEAELFTCLEGADEAQTMMVVPGYDPDFSVETFDGFGTFSVLPDEVTITSSVGSTSLPTLTTTAAVTGPHGISNKGTRFEVTIRCGPNVDFEALLAATPLTPADGVLSVPTLGHDLTVPLYDYTLVGVIQPIVTTATGGQFGDVNEFPIPSGALRSRAFTLQENGGASAPLGALTAFHVDAGDSLSSVVVHSVSDSLAAVQTSPGVWALQTAPDAVFNFEVPSSSQEGATDSVSSAIVGGTSAAASAVESNQAAADRPERRRLPVAFNVHDPCGAVSVPGAATADFSNADAYMGTNQVPSNIPHAAAPVPPEGSRVVPFCVELTDDGDNLDAVGGAKTTLVPAYLYILDRNDPPKLANTNPDPEGVPTYTDHFVLAENADVGVPFGIIRVADEDGDELSSIQVLGVGSEHFEFVHTGTVWRIHAKTSFDFENPPARSDGSQGSNTWELLVRLTDFRTDGPPASLDFPVTVTIEDVNEAATLDTSHPSATGIRVVDTDKAGDAVGTICFADPEGRGVSSVSFVDTNFIGTVIPDSPCAQVTLAVDADTFTPLAEGAANSEQLTFQVTDIGPNEITVVQHVTASYVDGNAPLQLVKDNSVDPALDEAERLLALNIAVVDEEPPIGLTLRVISVQDPSGTLLNAAQFQLIREAGGVLSMLVPTTLAVGAGYTVTVEAEEGGSDPNPAVRETTTFEVVDVELLPALSAPATMLETDQDLSFTYTDRDGAPHTFDWAAILRDTTEVERIDGDDLTTTGTGPFTVSFTCTSQCLDLDAGPGQLKVVFMSGDTPLQRDLSVTPVNEERSIAASLVSSTITDDVAVGTVVASITFGSDPEQSSALLTGTLSAPAGQDIAWLEVVTVDLTSAEVRVANGLALPEGASEIVDLSLAFTDDAGESISTTLPTLTVQDANAVPVYTGPETLILSETLPAGGRVVLDLATGVNVQDEEGEEVDSFTLTAATTGAGADMSSAFAVEGAMVKQVGALNWDAPDSITTVQLTGSIVMPSGPPGSVTLLITLTNDPNEFPGQLVDASPAWELQEGEASSVILDVTDADGAPYSIVTPLTGTLPGAGGVQLDVSAHFTASGLTLSTTGLDFEAFQAAPTDATLTFTLDVTVTDGHETLPAAIAVTLTNVNEPGMYNHAAALAMALRENSPAGTVVASLPKSLYSDPEQDALVSVTLAQTSTPAGDSDMFAVEEGVDAFDIVIAPGRHTDYEAHAQYEVVASLHESQFGSSDTAIVHTVTFTIMVTDVKKAPFALPADFAASTSTQHRLATLDMAVEENQPLGSVVGAFAVQDPDGDDIASVVLSGDQAAPFIVVSKGDLWQVQTLRMLDTEAQDTYTFAVVMTDATMRTNLVPVTVTVTDVPEMPTRPGAASLTAPVVWSVPETVAPGDFRRAFATADPDAGQHGQVRLVNAHSMFEIQHGDDGQYSLVNTGTLDFEAGATYSMQTQLVDEGTGALVSTFTTTVNVQDVNEAPTYTGVSTFTVLESAAVGTVVGTLTFADPEGHAVTATLSPASAPFALVATSTGYDLTTAGVLDWESGTTQYTLTLSGQDAGSPAQSVSATLVVDVADVVEPTPAATPTRTPVPTPTTTSTAAPTPSATGSPAPVQPSPSVTPSAAASPSTTPVPGVVRQPTDDVCKNARDHTVVGSEAVPNPIVIFAGTSVLTGMEVCKVDAAGSVTLLIDAYPGTAGSNPRSFRKLGPRVCWMSDVSEDSTQFLCYEPTSGVTVLRTLPRRRGRALASGTAPGTFLGASGSLAFFADDLGTPSTGVELYALDVESGTGAAPALVQDLTPGANSTTFTTAATAPDGTFYFTTTTALYRVQVGGSITASVTTLVIPRGASVHSTQAVRGAVLVTYTDAAGVAFLRRLDTTTGTVSVAAFEQVSDASTFATPRHAVAGANGSYFAWRSEEDASVDAVWVFDPSADQELAQVATLPAPAGAPENAVGVVAGLEVSNGRVYVEVASSVGSATGIFAWMGSAWAAITSVEVTAGRVSGSNPAALHAAGTMTLAFTTSDGTFILDTARAAVAAGVVPSPSATPSPSPAAAAAAVTTTVEEGDNSGAIGAGVALIAILIVAVGAFMVYRAGLCKRSKKEDKPAEAAAGSTDTGATAPSTDQASAAAAQA